MAINLDPWQEKFINTQGDKILCTGRQVGKSLVCSLDAGEYAVNNSNKTVLIIATTERQAYELFEKVLHYLTTNHKNSIKTGKYRPTKSKINLKNGTRILCLPTGISGTGIRGLTVHRLYVDEASRVPEEVWPAVTPMMLTTAGSTILLSTPAGKNGYFYDCWVNKEGAFDSFTRFSVESQKVVSEREICDSWTIHQREGALKLIEREKARMSALFFAQEYLGRFVDDLLQFFPTELIKSCMTLDYTTPIVNPTSFKCYLGVDVAGMGRDETVLVSLYRKNDRLYQFGQVINKQERTTKTVRRILDEDTKYRYKKIYIDDGGMGVGVFDPLLENSQTKRKVVAINNSARSIDRDERRKKLLKEDLYNNLLTLMEQGRIKLFKSDRLSLSLRSIQAEYSGGKLKIWGNYSHITEALIRAAWGIRNKDLNIYIHYS